ncbi:MAG: hypothetical protein ACOX2M_03720 [Fastidiosipilaceae bacterium]|jgi:hypothetical protein
MTQNKEPEQQYINPDEHYEEQEQTIDLEEINLIAMPLYRSLTSLYKILNSKAVPIPKVETSHLIDVERANNRALNTELIDLTLYEFPEKEGEEPSISALNLTMPNFVPRSFRSTKAISHEYQLLRELFKYHVKIFKENDVNLPYFERVRVYFRVYSKSHYLTPDPSNFAIQHILNTVQQHVIPNDNSAVIRSIFTEYTQKYDVVGIDFWLIEDQETFDFHSTFTQLRTRYPFIMKPKNCATFEDLQSRYKVFSSLDYLAKILHPESL